MKPASTTRMHGFALILVLWATALLAVMAASLGFATRTETALATNLVREAKAAALADAGIELGVTQLMSQIGRRDAGSERWRVDGSQYTVELGDGAIHIRIRSELGKIDLNTGAEALIAGLSSYGDTIGLERDLGAMILDWRDRDSNPRPGGAEDSDYFAAAMDYGARDAPFSSILELTQLLGVSLDSIGPLLDVVTIYARKNRLDPASASRQALLLVPGISADLVDNYLSLRETYADEGLPAPNHLLSGYDRFLLLSNTSPNGQGFVYTVEAEGALDGTTVVKRRATVQLKRTRDKPYIVVQRWHPVDSYPEQPGSKVDDVTQE